MRFAAPVWPFQWNPPYEDAIRRMAGLGFRQVELIAWSREASPSITPPHRVRELRSLMSRPGRVVSEFVLDCRRDGQPGTRGTGCLRGALPPHVRHGPRAGHRHREHGLPHPVRAALPPLKQLPTAQLWTVDLTDGLDWQRGWEAFVETTRRVVAVVWKKPGCVCHGAPPLSLRLERRRHAPAAGSRSLARRWA